MFQSLKQKASSFLKAGAYFYLQNVLAFQLRLLIQSNENFPGLLLRRKQCRNNLLIISKH